ncbi:MAG: hypothetical protein M3R02_12135 [Chloroflexota bacterium]|nr:hypothetical protein [Chloroflexota bacterium]
MRSTRRRLERLERTTGKSGPPLVVAFADRDGALHDPLTGKPLVPPPGAKVIVFTERPDGPQ